MKSIEMLKNRNLVTEMDVDTTSAPSQCEACMQAKQHMLLFPKESLTKHRSIGDLTLSDVWGLSRVASIHGDHYYVSFTDAKSRQTAIYFMKAKSEVLDKFKHYKNWFENQTGKRLKKLRVDNGTEYVNRPFKRYLGDSGISLEMSAPYSPSQNGITERLNQTLVQMACAMLISKNLPKFLWSEVVAYTCYLKNRSPMRALKGEKTPNKVFWGKKPSLADLQEFGAGCWVLAQDSKHGKLDPKSDKFIFTGITDQLKAWQYYDARMHSIKKSQNIIFEVPKVEPQTEPAGYETPKTTISHPPSLKGESAVNELPTGGQAAILAEVPKLASGTATMPKQATVTPSRIPISQQYKRPTHRYNYKELHNTGKTATNIAIDYVFLGIESLKDLMLLEEAMARSDWPKWKEAMDQEIVQLIALGTYSLAPLPPSQKAVRCKWVFHLKCKADGTIAKYKARLVAQGFSQIPGMDYSDTFVPVIRLESF